MLDQFLSVEGCRDVCPQLSLLLEGFGTLLLSLHLRDSTLTLQVNAQMEITTVEMRPPWMCRSELSLLFLVD